MALDKLNALLAETWRTAAATASGLLADKLPTLSPTSGIDATGLDAWIDLDAPPGFVQLDDQRIVLAAPLDPAGWKGRIGAFVKPKDGALRQLVPTFPLNAELRKLRLTLDAGLTTVPNDPRPHLKPASGDAQLNIQLHIELLRIGHITLDQTVLLTGNPIVLQTDVFLQLKDVVDIAGIPVDVRFEGAVTLTLDAAPKLEIDGQIRSRLPAIKVHRVVELKPIDSVMNLITILKGSGLPNRWPEHPVPTLGGLNVGAPIAHHAELGDQAKALEDAIKARLPDVLACDLVPARPDSAVIANTQELFHGTRDSAIWTGHMLAAEAFRVVTAAPAERAAALANLNDWLDRTDRLFDLPQGAVHTPTPPLSNAYQRAFPTDVFDPAGLFCRSVLPKGKLKHTNPTYQEPTIDTGARYSGDEIDQIDDAGNPTTGKTFLKPTAYYSTAVPLDGVDYYGFGRDVDAPTRDQTIGLALGLATTLALVDDAPTRARVAPRAAALVRQIRDHGWTVVTPQGELTPNGPRTKGAFGPNFASYVDMQLALLKLAAIAAPEEFGAEYAALADGVAEYAWLPIWLDGLDVTVSYFKFNLHQAALLILFLLETDPARLAHYRKAADMLWAAVKDHENPYFTLGHALAAGSASAVTAQLDAPISGGPTYRTEIRRALLEWKKRLGTQDLPQEKNPDSIYLIGLESDDYSSLRGDTDRYARFPLPVHKRPAAQMDFMWQREPFLALTKKNGEPFFGAPADTPDVVSPGIDFLLPHYLGRYVGLTGTPAPRSTPSALAGTGANVNPLPAVHIVLPPAALALVVERLTKLNLVIAAVRSKVSAPSAPGDFLASRVKDAFPGDGGPERAAVLTAIHQAGIPIDAATARRVWNPLVQTWSRFFDGLFARPLEGLLLDLLRAAARAQNAEADRLFAPEFVGDDELGRIPLATAFVDGADAKLIQELTARLGAPLLNAPLRSQETFRSLALRGAGKGDLV